MADNGDFEYRSYHILIDGSKGCGKSSIVNRFTADKFEHEKTLTRRYEVKKITVQVGHRQVESVIWDMSKEHAKKGPEKNQFPDENKESLNLMLRKPIKTMSGVIVLYDINNRRSYVEAKQRIRELQQIKWEAPVLLLAGNKIDRNEREVPEEEALHFAQSKLVNFIETSALSGYRVREAFLGLFTEIIRLEKFSEMVKKAKSEIKGYNLV